MASQVGGDRVCRLNLESLARKELGRYAKHVIFVDCPDASVILENNCWNFNPPDYLDGWVYEHPKPDPEVRRAILLI